MFNLSLLRLLATFLLLLLSLLAVTAAPLTGRTDINPRRFGKIMIRYTNCESARIYVGNLNSFLPVLQDGRGATGAGGNTNSEIFIGHHLLDVQCQVKPIAVVDFETVKRNRVYMDLKTVHGSSKWDYIAKAMGYLQQKEGLRFTFENGGEEMWNGLLEKCGGKQEPKTSEVHSSTAGSGYDNPVSPKKLPTLSNILIGGEAGNVTNAV
ncbi:uncharacterized protein C8R40DRAFT_1236819 [Lentinula edodes]|uniref:uncharacterized protein n=1 Tax=Lentinula edodes TaxID=5353 RepID=UPI001E8E2E1C|nr:uncharacterized protein C8R40DRAFT_1236819 [Lentinula edodes]KAH7875828.1 hypothetical protein C8R40DRAFT_1236819 [Lentinula edodes]